MKVDHNLSLLVEQAVRTLFLDARRLVLKNPSQAYFSLRTLQWQRKAAERRKRWQAAGVPVPPAMMMSITDRCNLRCQGCFAQAHRTSPREEMDEATIRSIFEESRDLGISMILLIGGEPLIRKEILQICRDFPEILFPVFTNGLFIDRELIGRLKGQKNVVPVLSLEGHPEETDGRRGKGVHRHLQGLMGAMEKERIFWGLSFTLTRPNFATVTDEPFIKSLTEAGCRLFFFVEFTLMSEEKEEWVLTGEQRAEVPGLMAGLESRFPGLFIAFPGGEERFGGCLSAGRGFVHINTRGDLEPCPFVPHSDRNLREVPLRAALQSEFLAMLRENHHELLGKRQGGCVLRENSEWVRALLAAREKPSGPALPG